MSESTEVTTETARMSESTEVTTETDEATESGATIDSAESTDAPGADGAQDDTDDAVDTDDADDVAVHHDDAVHAGDARNEADDEADQGDRADEGDAGEPPTRQPLQARLEEEGDVAADYLEELLDIADLDGDLDMDVEGERAMVSVVGADLNQLVGARGEVLEALQELTRLAVYRETGERSRLMLDISGHRAARRLELEALAATTVAEVKESGEQSALRPMSPFERKVVHDAVAAGGLTSESEGVEPRRYVVVLPA